MEGKLYRHFRKKGTFVVPNHKHVWGNDVVYGALFVLNDFHYYIRTLDAYQGCSLSSLMRNHTYDIHHRIKTDITPITFSSVEDFCTLRYNEKQPIRAYAYVGNPNHPKLKHQLQSRSRILDGLDKEHYKELLREVLT